MPTKLTRKQREHQQRRREILAAALELFSRHGYDGTSMAQIAERAEFAVGTLYKFFKDKQGLYQALIQDAVREFEQALTAALKTPGDEVDRIERYVETKAAMFFQHLPTAQLYFAQTAGARFLPTVGLDREVRETHERIRGAMAAVFRAGMRKKLFLKTDPRMLVLGLEGVGNALLGELVERPDAFTAETLADMTKTIFFERVRLRPKHE